MGKTAFKGPVYGAKTLLWSVGPITGTTGASTVLAFTNAARQVPPYEDWFITEVNCCVSTCSSVGNNIILKSEGGSTTGITRHSGGYPSTVAQTITTFNPLTSTTLNTFNTVTASAGEFEGMYVPAGSSLRIVSSGVNPLGQLSMQVMGYIRFVSSTRPEL